MHSSNARSGNRSTATAPRKSSVKKPVQHLRRLEGWSCPTRPDSIRAVKRAGHDPSIHGTKLWKSSCLIIDYLKSTPRSAEVKSWTRAAVGVSLVSGVRNTGMQTSPQWMRDPAVFPYLEAVARLNGVSTTPWVQRFEKVRKKDLENIDILFGGDICFWDDLVKPVGQMINRAIDAGVGTIVIGDPERPTFHEMAERAIQTHGGELLDWRIIRVGQSDRRTTGHT